MKARTHYVFSAGAGAYLLGRTGELSLSWVWLLIWLSLSVNFVIDFLGHHTGRSGSPSRSRLTHSVFTAPLWGAAIGFVSVYVASRLGFTESTSALVFWSAAGALIALGHLFLDSLSQAGVYYWSHRVALAHFSYNNLLLNGLFLVAGVALGAIALLQWAQ